MFTDAYTPDVNGVVSSIVTLKGALESLGHEVFVITTKPAGTEEGDNDHLLRLSGISIKPLYGYVVTSPYNIPALEKIRKMHLDVIHVHTEFSLGIFARAVSSQLHIPLVATYHTLYEDYTHYVNAFNIEAVDEAAKKVTWSLSKLVGDSCTALIVPSEKTRKRMEFYGVGKKIHVIPTGLDVSQFDPKSTTEEQKRQIRKKYGYADGTFVLAYVGRIAQEKSVDFLIRGFRKIKEDGREDIRFLIVGGGPQLDELKDLARSLGLLDFITFTGQVPHADVPMYYHMADAFASASVTETQGMTYIEALASGKVVFARNDEVLSGIVEDGVNGWLFDTSEEFAEKLEKFAQCPASLRAQMEKKALEKAADYDVTLFGKRVLGVYEEAIDIYHNGCRIKDVRYKDDLAILELESEDGSQSYVYTITVEQYVQGHYRREQMLTKEERLRLASLSDYTAAMQRCLRKLAVKDRTEKEMRDFLAEDGVLSEEQIEALIGQLKEKGYINDAQYMEMQIERMRRMRYGRQRIVHVLEEKGIPKEMVEERLERESHGREVARGVEWAQRQASAIRGKSVKAKKSAIRRRLASQGYESATIDEILARMDFSQDEEKEPELLEKTAHEAYERFKKKYAGPKLRNSTFRFLISRGFGYDDVYQAMTRIKEEEDEKDQ